MNNGHTTIEVNEFHARGEVGSCKDQVSRLHVTVYELLIMNSLEGATLVKGRLDANVPTVLYSLNLRHTEERV